MMLYIFRFLHQTTTVSHNGSHNWALYIFRFLHQTTTRKTKLRQRMRLYIFRFLHQTTTNILLCLYILCCISFVSYIKPQPSPRHHRPWWVVYLSFPTSNHNFVGDLGLLATVVYLSFPTSNHNYVRRSDLMRFVVYLSFPTSNHN